MGKAKNDYVEYAYALHEKPKERGGSLLDEIYGQENCILLDSCLVVCSFIWRGFSIWNCCSRSNYFSIRIADFNILFSVNIYFCVNSHPSHKQDCIDDIFYLWSASRIFCFYEY